MKKGQLHIKNIFWFLLICVNTTFAQMKQKDSYVVYINYPDYTVKTTVSNSTKRINVKESLTYYWYSSNKIIQTKGDYDGKIIDGAYTSFYLSNSLKEKGNFKKGLKDGKWISWYENGKINEITNWSRGAKSGEYKKFDSDGLISVSAHYKNDQLNGTYKTYTNAEMDKKTTYKRGKEIIKNPKNVSKTDSVTQSGTVQEKRSWKEKITAPFKKKKKKEAPVKNETAPTIQKKTWKEKLNSFFKQKPNKSTETVADTAASESQKSSPSETELSKKRKTRKNNKSQEADK
jgi:hypothetical protein